jgi:alkanesulfonate monooxygenase SsuD/methylene tetrahydromethanopterin reductase-like flavin-dependent oxidoreductase (luciferase family)
MLGQDDISYSNRESKLPFGFGSVSLVLYVHDLSPTKALDELFEQARRALDAGFDGVTLPEHHNGFRSYLPTPLQVVGWLLEEFRQTWAAAYPLLIPLRPVELWIEELAWLAARFPQRVGLGTGPGYVKDDFTATGADFAGRFDRYWASMEVLMSVLNGQPPESLARDPAVRALHGTGFPVVAAAVGSRSIANAGRLGLGIAPPGEDDDLIRIFQEYRAAGGAGPKVLNRWPWIGTVAADSPSRTPGTDDQASWWDSASSSRERRNWRDVSAASSTGPAPADHSSRQHDGIEQVLHAATPRLLAEELNRSIARCSATCLSIRLHKHNGIAKSPQAVRAMIDALAEVIPLLRFPHPLESRADREPDQARLPR